MSDAFDNTKHTVEMFRDHGLMPGSGTTAILANELYESIAGCDVNTWADIRDIVRYIHHESGLPREAFGSRDAIAAWIKRRGLSGGKGE